ncbi:MAG: Nin-like protein [Caulobacteraceae bacterium]|nr:Nin-like protein [Caulobacteraceae bacterium]
MSDPFLIQGPALVSFSGGRSSAYMLWRLLQAHGGMLPDDVVVAFANTGREREETLRFVYECGARWGVKIAWLEFVTDLKSVGPAGRIAVVGFNSASRNGEPLDRLIERKQALFSTVSGRWCTERAKVQTLVDYMETLGHAPGGFVEVIGFRSDEYDRVVELPLKPRNVARRFAFPLARAGVRRVDVEAFWWGPGRTFETSVAPQGFDLGLKKGTGNCDHCPFLSDKTRIARARLFPETLPWWKAHEAARDFSFGRLSFAEIEAHIAANPLLIPLEELDDDEPDSDCVGHCEPEAA